MRRVFSENVGESKLIIAQNADGYVGTILASWPDEGDNRTRRP